MRRSSLRCFFFDMRLRRFLMTEPMNFAAYLPTRHGESALGIAVSAKFPRAHSPRQLTRLNLATLPKKAAQTETGNPQPASKYELSNMS